MNKYDELFQKLYDIRDINKSFVLVGRHKVIKTIEKKAKTYFNVSEAEDIISSLNMCIYDILASYEKKNIKPISYIVEHLDDEDDKYIIEFNKYLYVSLYNNLIDMYKTAKNKMLPTCNLDDCINTIKDNSDCEYFFTNPEGEWITKNIENVVTKKQKEYLEGKKIDRRTAYIYKKNIRNRIEKAYNKIKDIQNLESL